MRKIKLLSFLLLLTFTAMALCGCVFSEKITPFSVFEGDFIAEISAELNGTTLGLICQRQGDVTKITLTSPDGASGYVFLIDAEKTVLRYGDVETAVQGRAAFLPELITELFAKNGDEITEIKTEKTESGTITLVKTPSVSFRFNENGLPAHADGIINGADVRLTFKSFSLAPLTEGSSAE